MRYSFGPCLTARRRLQEPGSLYPFPDLGRSGDVVPPHDDGYARTRADPTIRCEFAFSHSRVGCSSQPEPTLWDVLFLVFNFAACVPVWLCVGLFSCYHLYLAAGNSTTIEGWEKDKVATLVRRGKIAEIKYPYVRLEG